MAKLSDVHFPQVRVRSDNVANSDVRLSYDYGAPPFHHVPASCAARVSGVTTCLMNCFTSARMLCGLVGGLMLQTIPSPAALPSGLRVLFLGDRGHHRPADRFKQIQPVLANNAIELVYTDDLADLNAGKLAGFDCLIVYAN